MTATITLSDNSTLIALDQVCDECEGKGVIYNAEWQRWFEAGQQEGEQPRSPEQLTCGECEGRGSRPTLAGLAILMLVHRYSEPTRR